MRTPHAKVRHHADVYVRHFTAPRYLMATPLTPTAVHMWSLETFLQMCLQGRIANVRRKDSGCRSLESTSALYVLKL